LSLNRPTRPVVKRFDVSSFCGPVPAYRPCFAVRTRCSCRRARANAEKMNVLRRYPRYLVAALLLELLIADDVFDSEHLLHPVRLAPHELRLRPQRTATQALERNFLHMKTFNLGYKSKGTLHLLA
jgi:hypothetical protein